MTHPAREQRKTLDPYNRPIPNLVPPSRGLSARPPQQAKVSGAGDIHGNHGPPNPADVQNLMVLGGGATYFAMHKPVAPLEF